MCWTKWFAYGGWDVSTAPEQQVIMSAQVKVITCCVKDRTAFAINCETLTTVLG